MMRQPSEAPAQAMQPRMGVGTRLTVKGKSFAYSVPRGRSMPGLRFHPSLSGISLSFSRGLVELREPTIKDKRMSEAALVLDASKVNASGESWACVEVEFDEHGQVTAKTRLEVVQVDDPRYFTPDLARLPLALIVFNGRNPVFVDPVTQWNVRYYRYHDAEKVRHAFL